MSFDDKDRQRSDKGDSDEERQSNDGDVGRQVLLRRGASPSYDTPASVTYHKRTDVTRANGSEYTKTNVDVLRTAGYRTNDAVIETATEEKIYTRSDAETRSHLKRLGITYCENPTVIRRTITGQPVEYQQRVCLRYLRPPPPPRHGALTIEKIVKAGREGPPLVIHQQGEVVESQAPLILREKPPPKPVVLPAEIRREYTQLDNQQRSVIIEKYPTIQDKSRDIIIEKWLPYDPQPEREVIVKRINNGQSSRPTCTEIHYENLDARYSRRFVVIDVYNGDPDDYVARHHNSLLDARELIQEAHRAGVTEDISAPENLPIGVAVERKRVDYRDSKYIVCECFSTVATVPDNSSAISRSSYVEGNGSAGVTTITTTERRSNYKSSSGFTGRDGDGY